MIKVIKIHPQKNMNACTKHHGNPIVAETFQPAPKWPTNWRTDITIPWVTLLPWIKTNSHKDVGAGMHAGTPMTVYKHKHIQLLNNDRVLMAEVVVDVSDLRRNDWLQLYLMLTLTKVSKPQAHAYISCSHITAWAHTPKTCEQTGVSHDSIPGSPILNDFLCLHNLTSSAVLALNHAVNLLTHGLSYTNSKNHKYTRTPKIAPGILLRDQAKPRVKEIYLSFIKINESLN